MTDFLICPMRCKEKGVPYNEETPEPLCPHVSIKWCQGKCCYYDECEAREQFEIDQMTKIEALEEIERRYDSLERR